MSEISQSFNLISVKEQGGKQLVDARDLHSFLGLKRDFNDWIKYNIKNYDFVEQQDFTTFVGKSSGGRNAIEYVLTIEMAKELSMVSKTKKGKEARKYFISIEKKYINEASKPQVVMGEQTSKLFNTILDSVKQYSPTAAQTVGIRMLEAYGVEVPYTAHPLVVEPKWSATEIAKEIGSTANMVGRVANHLGLKVQPFSDCRMSVAKDTHKEVAMYYYTQRAKDKIKNYLFPNQNLLN